MIERYTLKNGIPVFVVENPAAPVVTIQAWINRGSAYETDKVAGISHFLEHSLFKGTRKRKVGEIALEVESCGGEINAFTSFEETVYYTTLGSRFLEKGLDIICDAIQNPSFDPDEMVREREVILEEIKRAQDSPSRIVSYNLWKTLFPQSPYGRPVLGFESSVKKIDHKVLRNYFENHYHAGSTALFIVGDIRPKEVLDLCQKKLGKMKTKKNISIPKVPQYLNSSKPKIVLAEKDIKECSIQIAWPTPPLAHEDIPTLDVLCTALGQGESSPLYQHLVKDTQVALDVSMGLVATARCGMAVLGLQVVPSMFQRAIEESFQLLEKITHRGIPGADVEKVKSALESEAVASKETVEGYARRLGYYTVQFGDPSFEKKYLDALLAVQPSDCSKKLMSILTKKPVLSAVHPLGFSVDTSSLLKILSTSPKKAPVLKEKAPEPVLSKKSSVRFVEKHISHLPIVSVKMIFPGGSREEKPNQLGLGTLLQRVWTSGTRHFNSQQISYVLDSLGASIHSFVGRHTMGLSLEFLAKQWPSVKPLLTDILLCPTFPETEFQIEKEILLQDIRTERDMPGQLCQINFMKMLYGEHPYGRSGLGTENTVKALTPQDLKGFYQDYVHQSGVVVSTVGNFEKNRWESEISELLQQLPVNGKTASKGQTIQAPRNLSISLEKKVPLQQSHLLIGFLGPSLHDSERFALKMLHSALAGQGGRLFLELRDRQSLAYTVAPIQSESPEGGMFGVYIGCSPEKLSVAVHGIRKELEKVIESTLSTKELSRAKQYWLGRIALDMQRFSSQAMMFGLDEMYGLGFDFSLKLAEKVKSLSLEDVRSTAEKYLNLEKAVISVVHNQDMEKTFIEHAWQGHSPLPSARSNQRTEHSL